MEQTMEELYRKYDKLGLRPYEQVPNKRKMKWHNQECNEIQANVTSGITKKYNTYIDLK